MDGASGSTRVVGRALGAKPFLLVAALILVTVFVAGFAVLRMGAVSRDFEDLIAGEAETFILVQQLSVLSERTGRLGRTLALTGDAELAPQLKEARREFASVLDELRPRMQGDRRAELLAEIDRLSRRYAAAVDRILAGHEGTDGIVAQFAATVQPLRQSLTTALEELARRHETALDQAHAASTREARTAISVLIVSALAGLLLSLILAWSLHRAMARLAQSRAELAHAAAHLAAANQDLDAFAGRVAHDLGNVLAPVPLTVARLEKVANSPEDVRACATRIARSVQRSRSLLDALLSFARAGQPADPNLSASLLDTVKDALADLEPRRLEVDATVTLDIEESRVLCAPALLHTVFMNIIGNALKFMQGRPTRVVTVRARRADAAALVTVEDTGPGIPPEAIGSVFRPFYRAPGSSVPGTGLGLATVKRIVEAHAGRIEVQAGEAGTIVTIVLRSQETAAVSAPQALPAPQPAT